MWVFLRISLRLSYSPWFPQQCGGGVPFLCVLPTAATMGSHPCLCVSIPWRAYWAEALGWTPTWGITTISGEPEEAAQPCLYYSWVRSCHVLPMSRDSLECPQQPVASGEIPVGSLYPLVHPPAQVFEVSDMRKNYHRVSRLNVLNTCEMLEECFPALVSVASCL